MNHDNGRQLALDSKLLESRPAQGTNKLTVEAGFEETVGDPVIKNSGSTATKF